MPSQGDRKKLARRYRLLLSTYPRSYRRRRGPEIVTTLLDAAPADRGRPTGAEARDLLLGGLRHRFRVWGRGWVTAAVGAALVAAVALGSLGGYLGWQDAPPLPSNAEAARMLGPALPPGASPDLQRWDFVFDNNPEYLDPDWVFAVAGTDEYRAGKVFVQFTYPNDNPRRGVVETAGQRLRAAGWEPARQALGGCCPEVTVHRDGWLLEVFSAGDRDDSRYDLEIALSRSTPPSVLPLTTVGLILGGMLGWLLTAWVFRRTREVRPVRRTSISLVGGGGLLALLPATVVSALALFGSYLDQADPVPGWLGYTLLLFRPLAYLGGATLVGVLLLAALPADEEQRGFPLQT